MTIQYEVSVSKDRYFEIIGFTEYVYITGYIGKYSGILRGKRALGEYIENFVYGKLAEEAFKQFLMKNFQLNVITDLDLADFVVSDYLSDLIAIKEKDQWDPLKFWVDVKEVRRDQKWLLVPASGLKKRCYDEYVAVWVGLPDDHLVPMLADVPYIKEKLGKTWKKYASKLKDSIENIRCRIIGFVTWNDIENVKNHGDAQAIKSLNNKYGERGWHYFDGNTKLYDPDNDKWKGSEVGENAGIALNRLAKSSSLHWQDFSKRLGKNKRIVPLIPLKYTTKKGKKRSHSLPSICKPFAESALDYREVHQRCLESQLNKIHKDFGFLRRRASWFQQTLKLKDQQSR